ncbi:MAG TPA: hypothetical protein VGQ83_35660 [Polyangia bacterium]
MAELVGQHRRPGAGREEDPAAAAQRRVGAAVGPVDAHEIVVRLGEVRHAAHHHHRRAAVARDVARDGVALRAPDEIAAREVDLLDRGPQHDVVRVEHARRAAQVRVEPRARAHRGRLARRGVGAARDEDAQRHLEHVLIARRGARRDRRGAREEREAEAEGEPSGGPHRCSVSSW